MFRSYLGASRTRSYPCCRRLRTRFWWSGCCIGDQWPRCDQYADRYRRCNARLYTDSCYCRTGAYLSPGYRCVSGGRPRGCITAYLEVELPDPPCRRCVMGCQPRILYCPHGSSRSCGAWLYQKCSSRRDWLQPPKGEFYPFLCPLPQTWCWGCSSGRRTHQQSQKTIGPCRSGCRTG